MIELKNIQKSFKGRKVLNDINLKIEDGEILAIVGPSGAGKTTLLRALTGLGDIDSGQILLDGQAFDPKSSDLKNNVIGVVFQDYNLFPNLTVWQNITLAPKLVLKMTQAQMETQIRPILAQLKLDGKEGLYPFELSGGMKQRVAIARALAMQPKVLAYDEPTSALDPSMRSEVANLLLDLKKDGVTQIVVTHDFELANKVADKIFTVNTLN